VPFRLRPRLAAREVDQAHGDLWHVGEAQDGVTCPIQAGEMAAVEMQLFHQRGVDKSLMWSDLRGQGQALSFSCEAALK
jgi:hypothetical protein